MEQSFYIAVAHRIAGETGISEAQAKAAIRVYNKAIAESLSVGIPVDIPALGRFTCIRASFLHRKVMHWLPARPSVTIRQMRAGVKFSPVLSIRKGIRKLISLPRIKGNVEKIDGVRQYN